jgi:excisionase family DNA binding protein
MTDKNGEVQNDILNIDEAAALLGVSVKTFNKVLHAEDMPARKIGREWKFSRKALIEWVEGNHAEEDHEITPARSDRRAERGAERSPERPSDRAAGDKPRTRRTAGWAIELD